MSIAVYILLAAMLILAASWLGAGRKARPMGPTEEGFLTIDSALEVVMSEGAIRIPLGLPP